MQTEAEYAAAQIAMSEGATDSANANLIASAPDLYEALADARDLIHAEHCEEGADADAAEREFEDTDDWAPIHCEECRTATAALAKAQPLSGDGR